MARMRGFTLKIPRLLAPFAFATLAHAAQAGTAIRAPALLAAPESALGGAILTRAEGAADPARVNSDHWVRHWTDPGFRMMTDKSAAGRFDFAGLLLRRCCNLNSG